MAANNNLNCPFYPSYKWTPHVSLSSSSATSHHSLDGAGASALAVGRLCDGHRRTLHQRSLRAATPSAPAARHPPPRATHCNSLGSRLQPHHPWSASLLAGLAICLLSRFGL